MTDALKKRREGGAGRLAALGLLTALGLAASYAETLIPVPVGIPGIKLGLANLVAVWALYDMGPGDALGVNLLRILLAGFLFGNLSMILYSLAGAALSFCCMYLAKRSGLFSLCGVSVIGGVTHNIGQLLTAMAVLESVNLVYYGPVLLAAGTVTGLLVGVMTVEIRKRLPAGLWRTGQ
ncbi:MAG: Gx transporter family protein [Eubacteriales bacterium]|nr:Gx transporter family protein [Eubacteriales bacterium]